MAELSRYVYQYLCQKVVGTPKVVQYRRSFYEAFEDVENSHLKRTDTRLVASGSKAEGMDLPGSDIDIMYVLLYLPVYEYNKQRPQQTIKEKSCYLYMDDELANAGFTLLRVPDNFVRQEITTKTDFGTYLSNKVWKMLHLEIQYLENWKINGPCITNKDDTVDHAFALGCKTWPDQAQHWTRRRRTSGWPSNKLVCDIYREGVLLVPIGSKSDSTQDNHLEWRLSFSVPEKRLIHSWNHSQFLCYALLKLYLKEIKKTHNIEKLICSYFLKTTVLWIMEESSWDIWTPQNLLNCFLLCMRRLIYWYDHGFIPNYFIPQHNMIDRKIQGQSRSELVDILKLSYRTGSWFSILDLEPVEKFQIDCFSSKLTQVENDINTAMVPSIPLLIATDFGDNEDRSLAFCEACSLTRNVNLRRSIRRNAMLLLQHVSGYIAKSTFFWNFENKNKIRYRIEKRWLSCALIGTYTDSVSGWLLVALYFYLQRQCSKSLDIINYTESTLFIEKIYISRRTKFTFEKVSSFTRRLNHIKGINNRLKLQLLLFFDLENEPSENFEEDEDLYLLQELRQIICPPVVFLYYLEFLCYRTLKRVDACKASLQNLERTVENRFYIDETPLQNLQAVGYVWKAFHLAKEYEKANYWFCKLIDTLRYTEE